MRSLFLTITVVTLALMSVPLSVLGHELNPGLVERLTGEKVEHDHEISAEDPRFEERTFASFPEWYVVYSAEEYADFMDAGGRPSRFPYFGAIGQYWDAVTNATGALDGKELDSNTETVLRFIGVSFTIEYALIGLYEKTVGRLTELLSFGHQSGADQHTEAIARDYAEFLLHTPWYDFPYFSSIAGLWTTPISHPAIVREIERRSIFTLSYAIKGIYGQVMGYLSNSSLGAAELTTSFTVTNISAADLGNIAGIEILGSTGEEIEAKAPRYRLFTDVAKKVAVAGGSFKVIEGHDEIMVTAIAENGNSCLEDMAPLFQMPILTRPSHVRFAFLVPVPSLHQAISDLADCGYRLEHLYDY